LTSISVLPGVLSSLLYSLDIPSPTCSPTERELGNSTRIASLLSHHLEPTSWVSLTNLTSACLHQHPTSAKDVSGSCPSPYQTPFQDLHSLKAQSCTAAVSGLKGSLLLCSAPNSPVTPHYCSGGVSWQLPATHDGDVGLTALGYSLVFLPMRAVFPCHRKLSRVCSLTHPWT
jgi:hypothetical protein